MRSARSASSLIAHVDGNETPACGLWAVVPAHTRVSLDGRRRLGSAWSASGAAVAGTMDVDDEAQRCRTELSIDTGRLTSGRPAITAALAGRILRVHAVRTGPFGAGGWPVAGTVTGGDETVALDAWIEYHGVYRRGPDLSYAWLTTRFCVPAAALGLGARRLGRCRLVAIDVDVLATADALTPPSVAA